ncbi:hypothetical protein Tco_1457537 [Tanacetum coccineum]
MRLVDLEQQIQRDWFHQEAWIRIKTFTTANLTLPTGPEDSRTETLGSKDGAGNAKGNVTSSKPATLHDAIKMARELIEQGVQAKALRIGDSNKRKWEDQQGNNYHQQQNRRHEATKVYVAAPAKGRGYARNLP